MSKLVIVESPAKAKTIEGYLGPDFTVEASIGHIRDLPQPSELPPEMKKSSFGRFAVDVDNGFTPYYVVNDDKKRKVTELKRLLAKSDELYLATDEDREGEAIAWHLLEVLKPKIPVKRMVFHEITKEAIDRALDSTRALDTQLVDAQESRRILDRLYGYEVSPVLWRKIKPGLSAGRVQSVATRLVVERERERMAFISATYWDVSAEFEFSHQAFTARLAAVDGARVATGKDYCDTGTLTSKAVAAGVLPLSQNQAGQIADAVMANDARVEAVEAKPYKRRPSAPFTTSTLQQEASRKLRMSARETMRHAQFLYENGYITYMRTDSVNLSSQALSAARRQAAELYGEASLPSRARVYSTKAKGAQEAHEAIRPAGDNFRRPSQVRSKLSGPQFALYELIWKRTIASQMNDAIGETTTIQIDVPVREQMGDHHEARFTASGTVITSPGFLQAYEEGSDAKRYEDKAQNDRLPAVHKGDQLLSLSAEPEGHETAPPPRYTEASLVKTLEEKGIGRPSTYAATISTITDRGYVSRKGQALVPSWLAFSVVRLLEENLPTLIDYDFTAAMENELDAIAAGQKDRVAYLDHFYNGDHGLHAQVEGLGDIDARAINTVTVADGVTVRNGRYGAYVENADGARASVPEDVAPDELTAQMVETLLAKAGDNGRILGTDPSTGWQIVAKDGRFGPYVTEIVPDDAVGVTPTGRPSKRKPKARTASLFKTMDLGTVTLEEALKLLSIPRVVGTDSEGAEIVAHNGRFGPYLTRGSDSRSLESEDQIFTVTLEEALELFSKPKQRRSAQADPGKEIGTDPATGLKVMLKDGRFGPYVTDGTTNASLRTNDDPLSLTAERAYELLQLRREKLAADPNGGKKRGRGTTRKSSTTRKASTTKSTTKRATKSTSKSTSTTATKKTTTKKAAE